MKPKHPDRSLDPHITRGVGSIEEAAEWFRAHRIEEIECVFADLAGVPRGKIMPARKFLNSPTMRLPLSIFYQTITGEYPGFEGLNAPLHSEADVFLTPDFSTLAAVPWAQYPTAQVIHDAQHSNGNPVQESPRQVLRRVLEAYSARGWTPLIAPEIEFYLVEKNTDPDYPLKPPVGRSGRAETGRQGYSVTAVNEFDPLFEDMYAYCQQQGLEIDTLTHEMGVAQMEINLRHGSALELADQVFMFKRTIRETALEHGIYATFMAKPMSFEPGSSMHIHQSISSAETGRNLFCEPETGKETREFYAFIAGQQRYTPALMAMLAPHVNSYRRLALETGAPTNLQWGYDNRTVGLRVPISEPSNRRVEHRIPSSDANPYLAIAGVLAAGYLGMAENLTPSEAFETDGAARGIELPQSLLDSLVLFESCAPIAELLGPTFVAAFSRVKHAEYDAFMRTISSWEREFLLLNV